METKQRGGKRPGAGRPKKAATVTISFRVRVEWADEIKTEVNAILLNKICEERKAQLKRGYL